MHYMVTGPTNANKRTTVSYILKIVCLLHASPTNVAIHREVRLVCHSETLNYLLPLRDVCYPGYKRINSRD